MGLGESMAAGVVSYVHMLVVVFYAGLVSLTYSCPSPCSPYSSEIIHHLAIFYSCVF